MDPKDAFDGWLEDELGRELACASGTSAPPPPLYRTEAGERSARLRIAGLTSIPLALSLKPAAALAAAAIAVGGASIIEFPSHLGGDSAGGTPPKTAALSAESKAADSTESPSATNHGSAVTSAVASCKAARPSPDASPEPSPGSRGIGRCVSTVANGERSGGTSSEGTGTGNGNGNTSPSGNANGNGNDGHPTPDPHPTPHAHPTPAAGHPTPPPHP
jgi:hypothetical protein